MRGVIGRFEFVRVRYGGRRVRGVADGGRVVECVGEWGIWGGEDRDGEVIDVVYCV